MFIIVSQPSVQVPMLFQVLSDIQDVKIIQKNIYSSVYMSGPVKWSNTRCSHNTTIYKHNLFTT